MEKPGAREGQEGTGDIVTSHNSPVNLPVKGQARGKTVDTIETSSEKITLNLQRKNN